MAEKFLADLRHTTEDRAIEDQFVGMYIKINPLKTTNRLLKTNEVYILFTNQFYIVRMVV